MCVEKSAIVKSVAKAASNSSVNTQGASDNSISTANSSKSKMIGMDQLALEKDQRPSIV